LLNAVDRSIVHC